MPRPILAAFPILLGALAGCDVFDNIKPGGTLADVFDGPTAEDAAEWALDDYNPDNRFRGTTILASQPFGGEEIYLQLYRDRINDEDAGVRQAAVRALGLHGSTEDVPAIAERLADSDRTVRAEAARSLQRLHNPAAIEPLIARLPIDAEPESVVRAESARALGQYRDGRVVQELIAALEDRSLAVNSAAVASLETLTGQNFGYDTALWLEWVDAAEDPFRAGRMYTYPGFSRPRHPIEWLPLVPQPPSVPEGAPVGLPRNES